MDETHATVARSAWHESRVGTLMVALFVWLISSSIAVVGALLGFSTFVHSGLEREEAQSLIEALANWDGCWYAGIVRNGYSFTTGVESNVAFFPVFPVVARGVSILTGMSAEASLLCVAHVCTAASFILMVSYARRRYVGQSGALYGWILLAIGGL